MSKYQRRKFKYVTIRLFKEEGLLTDILFFQYNLNTDTINIYDMLSFQTKRVVYSKICEAFTKRKSERSSEAKNRMRELILNEPTISSQKIVDLTGINSNLVTRYYMRLKKEYNGKTLGGDMIKLIRQGDILLKEICIEDFKNKIHIGNHKKVLAYGERTGHSHVLNGDVEFYDDGNGQTLCRINGIAELVHEEHGNIEIPIGDYIVINQREFDAVKGIRTVID